MTTIMLKPSFLGPPPGLSSPCVAADGLDWLRQLLSSAQLDEHFQAAAAWADSTGCVQTDLDRDECLQELIDALALKKFPAQRLRNAHDTYACQSDDGKNGASTVASMTEVAELSCEQAYGPAMFSGVEIEATASDLQFGRSVLVAYDAELFVALIQCQNPDGTFRVIYDVDGTYEDVEMERITSRSLAETNVAAVTSSEVCKVSKRAKARARKQIRDAANTLVRNSNAGISQVQGTTSIGARQQVLHSAKNNPNVRAEASQSSWSVSREGCKTLATLAIPCRCVGWVIGPNGTQIKHIEKTFLVEVRVVSETVSVHGKHERVKSAVAYISNLLG